MVRKVKFNFDRLRDYRPAKKLVRLRYKEREEEEMEKEKINQAVGKLLCKDKYKFLPNGLVGEIVKDFIEEVEK